MEHQLASEELTVRQVLHMAASAPTHVRKRTAPHRLATDQQWAGKWQICP
ncbi:hypothetical protein [Yinghuangia sp. YIM S09857]